METLVSEAVEVAGKKGIVIEGNPLEKVNPVRRPSTFQRGGSHGALNAVFALKGIISSSPLQAAGLSNGAKAATEATEERFRRYD